MNTDNTTFQYRITFPYLRRRVTFPDKEVKSLVGFVPYQKALLKIEQQGGELTDDTVYNTARSVCKQYIVIAGKYGWWIDRHYTRIMNGISEYRNGDKFAWCDGSDDGIYIVGKAMCVNREGLVIRRPYAVTLAEKTAYDEIYSDIPKCIVETLHEHTSISEKILYELVSSDIYGDVYYKLRNCRQDLSANNLYSAFKSSYKEHLRAHTPVSEQDETALTHLSAYLTGDPYAWCDGAEDGLYAIRQAMRSPDGGSRAIVLTAEEYEAMKARAEAMPDVPEDL